jgi:lysophospholipase L1-like esterase
MMRTGLRLKLSTVLLLGIGSALLSSATLAAETSRWVGTWATAVYAGEPGRNQIADVTLRQIAHLSIGGKRLRVRFSNEFGTVPLEIGPAAIALSAGSGGIQADTDHALTFDGRASAKIPAGATLFSDPVDWNVPPQSDVAVSFYLPRQDVGGVTHHGESRQTQYQVNGNAVHAAALENATTQTSLFFLSSIDVLADKAAHAVVALGDSITDGSASTRDTNRRWPDFLARRLAADKRFAQIGVLNEGIGGARLLNPNTGPAVLARFDRDVIAQTGVSHVIVLIGINDLGRWGRPHIPADEVTAEEVIAGLRQLIVRAHDHGIKIIGATITPYEGAGYFSAKGETMRQTVNQWIRDGKQFDGVADFEAATRDPEHPARFSSATDSGDHLHPNDAGMEAMANAVELALLK